MTDANKQSPALPPSDEGGADWATKAGHDIADSVGKGLAASTPLEAWAIKQLGATYAAIIRKHAPTQQPAVQPEAGGELQAIYIEAANIRAELDLFRQGSNITVLERIQDRLKKIACGELAATPRPESPDAQRGELRGLLERVLSMPDLFVGAFPSQLNRSVAVERILSGLSALPAKGPGPRSDEYVVIGQKHKGDRTEYIWWFTPPEGTQVFIKSPPASHSKQREQRP